MDVTALNRITQALPAAATPIPADKASENRQVVQAVKALSKSEMFGENNELVYQRDPETQRMLVKIVNRTTQDVVSQIPSDYVLRLVEELKQKR